MKPITPVLTVDTIISYKGKVVLVKRKNNPHKGMFALPGGFVDVGETVESAAAREAKEETGLIIEDLRLVGVYSEPSRDPRSHTVSICFFAIGRGKLEAGSDAKETQLFKFKDIPKLAFDHNRMIYEAQTYILIGEAVHELREAVQEIKNEREANI